MSIEVWLDVLANLAALAAFVAVCFLLLGALLLWAEWRTRRGRARAARQLGLASRTGSDSTASAGAEGYWGVVDGLDVTLGASRDEICTVLDGRPPATLAAAPGTAILVVLRPPLAFRCTITRGAPGAGGFHSLDPDFDRRCRVETDAPAAAAALLASPELRAALRELLCPGTLAARAAFVCERGVLLRTLHRSPARLVAATRAAVAVARRLVEAQPEEAGLRAQDRELGG